MDEKQCGCSWIAALVEALVAGPTERLMDMLTEEEVKQARDWWTNVCPEEIKGNCSIWTVLARYGRYVLKTQTVSFNSDDGGDDAASGKS